MRTDSQQPGGFRKGLRLKLRLHWAHGACFVLGLGASVSLHLGAAHFGYGVPRSHPASAPHAPDRAGPWGELECTTLDLERPDDALPPPTDFPPLCWVFENSSREEVERLFRTCDLAPAHTQALLAEPCWQPLSNGWQVFPPVAVVRDMDRPARRAIYARLAQSSANVAQQCPLRMPAAGFDRWLARSGLPADTRELIRRLTLPEGDTMAFCDGPLVGRLCAPEESRHLAKALSYVPALLMNLRVTPASDIDALAAYWGRPGRGNAMRPFLESLACVPGSASVSVSFFFPAFARLRLYTYPDPATDRLALRQDCYWTALNFFNETPDNRFLDERIVQRTLKTEYLEIKAGWTFGDLILLLDHAQTAFHVCVYVADGVVFTKNGVDAGAPWVLMRIPDMLSFYAWKQRIELVGLRHKGG